MALTWGFCSYGTIPEDSSARRRLCWLVLIMAVRGLHEGPGWGRAGRAAAEPGADSVVPAHLGVPGRRGSWDLRSVDLAFCCV